MIKRKKKYAALKTKENIIKMNKAKKRRKARHLPLMLRRI